MKTREDIIALIEQLYNNKNISIGIHGTAVLPDAEQKHQKDILKNGLMCRYGDIRRTVAFQDRGTIHAHGNINFDNLTSYTYKKAVKGYLYKEKKEGNNTSYEPIEIDLEQCSFIVAIPREMSTIDDNLFSGSWQKHLKKSLLLILVI